MPQNEQQQQTQQQQPQDAPPSSTYADATKQNKKPGPYIRALQAWNKERGGWLIPKRGTKEYAQVMALMVKQQAKEKVS